jgi:hypothetical protein
MPVCGQSGCSCSPDRRRRKRRYGTSEGVQRIANTRNRLFRQLQQLGSGLDAPTVSLMPSPYGGEYQMITVSRVTAHLRYGDGSVFFHVKGKPDIHFPYPKRTKGLAAAKRIRDRIIHHEEYVLAEAEAELARQRAAVAQWNQAQAVKAEAAAVRTREDAAREALQRTFDGLVIERRLSMDVCFRAEDGGKATVHFPTRYRLTPEQARKFLDTLLQAGLFE